MKQVAEQFKNENPVYHKPFTVFLVDDDETYLSALGFQLMKDHRNNSAKVYCYASGEECIANLHRNPGVIVLDYYLSTNQDAMSGLDVLRNVKRIKPGIPVVVLSSQSDIMTALGTFEEGAYTYVVKDKHAIYSIEKIINALMQPPKKGGPY
jgi:two-component system OmpR family response regulator